MNNTVLKTQTALLLAAFAFAPLAANADSGFYVGGSLGGATIEANFGDTGIPGFPEDIDEDDTAYKVFAGYKFDLPVLDLGVEAGYVDFGAPEIDVLAEEVDLEPTGINLWGIAGIEAGPVDLFAKLGYISWDIEASVQGQSVSDDGSDLGYGVGLSFGLGSLSVRGEYEVYDIEDADVSMLSLGLVYQFD